MPSKSVFQIKFSNPNLTFQELNLLWHTKLLSPCPSRFLPSSLTEQLHACNASEMDKILIVQSCLHMQCKEMTTPPGSLCKLQFLWLKLRPSAVTCIPTTLMAAQLWQSKAMESTEGVHAVGRYQMTGELCLPLSNPFFSKKECRNKIWMPVIYWYWVCYSIMLHKRMRQK